MNKSSKVIFLLRKKAIRDFLSGKYTQKQIYIKYNKTRYWFEYWFDQYKTKGINGLRSKPEGFPKGKSRKYSTKNIDSIVDIRARLENDPKEYYYGAERIQQEFIELGYKEQEIPSIPYIKKVLSKKGCVKKTQQKDYIPLKGYPEIFIKLLKLVCQIDFIGYKRINNSNDPIHFLAITYRDLKYGNIWRIKSEQARSIMPLLFDFWKNNPIPKVVQMDNDWAFLGSGSAQGTISKMIRFLLFLRITPLFIPESAPWRNGSVEGTNSIFGKKFWQKHNFESLEQIDKQLTIYNQRTKEYKFKKFNINVEKYNSIDKERSFTEKIVKKYKFKRTDCIYFIRLGKLVNEEPSIKVLNYLISISEKFLNHYILCKLNICSQKLFLYQEVNDKLIKIKVRKIKLNI
jgi:hypothetical protein